MARVKKKERLHVTLPEDLLRALEVRRELEGKHRSEAMEEAVRCWLAGQDAEELEKRLGIVGKLGDLEELMLLVRDRLGELTTRNLYSSERVYALFEAQFAHNPQANREETQRTAHERIDRMRRSEGEGG